MIKPTELRLNNYLHDNKGRLCKVTEIGGDLDFNPRGFQALAISGKSTALPNKPIPITEEWLIKFGFKKIGKSSEVNCSLKVGGMIIDVEEYSNKIGTYLNMNPVNAEYIHELQNLFFALSGKELTIKN